MDDDPEALGILGYALARTGRRRDALTLVAKMRHIQQRRPVPAAFFADVYLGLGENEQALELLERACASREGRLVQLKVNPRYDPLRSNPRFSVLLKRLGLDEL
jgi:Flp pilus assembly protein TadD